MMTTASHQRSNRTGHRGPAVPSEENGTVRKKCPVVSGATSPSFLQKLTLSPDSLLLTLARNLTGNDDMSRNSDSTKINEDHRCELASPISGGRAECTGEGGEGRTRRCSLWPSMGHVWSLNGVCVSSGGEGTH